MAGRLFSVDPLDKLGEIGDKLVKRGSKRFPAADEYVIMLGPERGRTSPDHGPQPPFDAIPLGRIAAFLADGQANTRQFNLGGHRLQSKIRTPGAIAPGGPQKLGPFGEPSQARAALRRGHRALGLRPRASCGQPRGGDLE
jgi:hypothetical protein